MLITASMVNELRGMTGAGMMDCKKALTESDGNMDKAVDILRERGIAKAAKKEARIAAEGCIFVYSHGGKYASMVELNTETDFAAKNDSFQQFGHNIGMQIVASRPKYVTIEEVPQSLIESESAIYRAQLINEGKPEAVIEKILPGKIKKMYEEIVLMEQPYIMDPDKKVSEVLTELRATIGEKITIRRFYFMEMGEGLEKRNDDFAAEVAAQSNQA